MCFHHILLLRDERKTKIKCSMTKTMPALKHSRELLNTINDGYLKRGESSFVLHINYVAFLAVHMLVVFYYHT